MLLIQPPPPERYSAEVRLELVAQNRVFELAKSGPQYAFLREPSTIPVGDADLVMTVDGRRYIWKVQLKCETTPIDGKVEFDVVFGPVCPLPKPPGQQLSLFCD